LEKEKREEKKKKWQCTRVGNTPGKNREKDGFNRWLRGKVRGGIRAGAGGFTSSKSKRKGAIL